MNTQPMIQGTYGTLYYVYDMKKSVDYYKNMFNLEPSFESPGWTEFSLNGHSLCLHATGADQKVDGKGILITKVVGIQETVSALKAKGMEFISDIHSVCDGGYAADFRDPSGNMVSLFEYTGK